MHEDEIVYSIALTLSPGIGLKRAAQLIRTVGSAAEVYHQRDELPKRFPDINPALLAAINDKEAIARAREEYTFMTNNHIRGLCYSDDTFPALLRDCVDAPVILFYRGNANLNATHVVSMVGTRRATEYGRRLCANFLSELRTLCPDTLIVSGLAYGIDVAAHRQALANGIPTVGILAHGLDRIYPAAHRRTAIEMLGNGGLLTEFLSHTEPDRHNFIRRNRIIAGMSHATIVVESAEKGGSLITAHIASSYNRECFAFPGNVSSETSRGCNALVRDRRASLITSAADFVREMGWDGTQTPIRSAVQRSIFPNLSPDEQRIVDILQSGGDSQINALVAATDIPVYKLSALLFDMEMRGIIKMQAGGTCCLA